ncbi:hypothetical protein B0H16DRAFT_1721023 [Mycena metata]|uniref:Uncharacterized protein n=1 Tax=Mycena metata TaxID=1033252 RepID=A0AAD7GWB2_9AGAR|nr:hypothetical protein B0H16DRAFT_1746820 [Mycena metata]KAJ7757891.1 hypothetical protein B0H16DRAFT_1721023 [Mycena metata]
MWGLKGWPNAVHQLRRVVATASTEVTTLPPPSSLTTAVLTAVLIACRRRRRHCSLPLPSRARAAIKPPPDHIAHQQHVPHITPPLPHITPTPPPTVPTPDINLINYFFSIFSFHILL